MNFTVLQFPRGEILLAKSHKGLSLAHFIKNPGDFEITTNLFKKKAVPLERNDNKLGLERSLFESYFSGKQQDFSLLPLDLIFGTPFQKKVWLETRKIPHGKTVTYKYLAQQMHHKGFRSIGQALSKNPIAIIIPCHRVLQSDGTLGGFSAGLELKRYLLRLESGDNPT